MKGRCAACCVLLLLIWLPGRAQDSHASAGVAYFREGQYAKALEEFQQARDEHPRDAPIFNLLGITETKLGDLAQADVDYERAIAMNPAFTAARKNLAVNLMTASRYDEAEDQLDAALKLDANDKFLHSYLASLYLATQRDRMAVAQIDAAQPLIDNDPVLLSALTMACLRLHENAKALALIRTGEEKRAFDTSEEYQLALLMTESRMYPEAVERFRIIEKTQQGSWASRIDLALALLNADEAKEAAAILARLADERPNDKRATALLAWAYELAGENTKALGAYRAAVIADPDNADLRLDYARLLVETDRYAEAASIIQAGIERAPDSYALTIRQGSIETLQGRLADARRSFRAAIEDHPEISLGYFALAQSYMRDGHDQQALDVLATAHMRSQPDAKIEYLEGMVLAHLGRRDEAVAALRASIRLDAAVAEPHYELGRLLFEGGSFEPAKAELGRAAVLAPDHANAFYQLSRIYGRLGDAKKSAEMAQQTQRLLAQSREKALEEQRAKLTGFQEVHRP
jgi:tetratricopeptide (TPR) repeat protein